MNHLEKLQYLPLSRNVKETKHTAKEKKLNSINIQLKHKIN